jgi:MoxR-like ATPase
VFARTTAEEILQFQWLVRQVPMSQAVGRKAVELIRATRPSEAAASAAVRKYVRYGASVRATQFLALAAKARALMEGRFHVTDADLRALAPSVLRHRVLTNYQAEADGMSTDAVLRDLIDSQIPG